MEAPVEGHEPPRDRAVGAAMRAFGVDPLPGDRPLLDLDATRIAVTLGGRLDIRQGAESPERGDIAPYRAGVDPAAHSSDDLAAR